MPVSRASPAFAASPQLRCSRHPRGSTPLCAKPSGTFHPLPHPSHRKPATVWRCEASREPAIEPAAVEPTSPKPPSSNAAPYRVELLSSVTDLSASEWDSFACAGSASPFLRHAWLRCLESSGCASADTGWSPRHVLVRDLSTNAPVALAPAYLKQHSLGEFVFDHDWAEAAYGAGIPYYPKLLLAVPFTPATGRRVLTRDDVDARERRRVLRVVAGALIRLAEAMGVSSVHVNFCADDEVEALAGAGFLRRKGVQYHFTNYKKGRDAIADLEKRVEDGGDVEGYMGVGAQERVPYRDFEDYLSEFKSKRRIKMRRERTQVRDDAGLEVVVMRGEELDEEMMETMYRIYKSTIDKLFYGKQYLTRSFFRMLAQCDEFKQCICLVLARRKGTGEVVGGTFNVIGDGDGGAFYGRYWGCVEEVRYLHFEACYYAAIEYCIENGLARMEPGAGGGDFKYMRGFEPALTNSMHYLRDRRLSDAVERYLQMESMQIDGAVLQMKEQSAIRSKAQKNSAQGNGKGELGDRN